MFTTRYTIQAPRGFLFVVITTKCKMLNEQDTPTNFSFMAKVNEWFSLESSERYLGNPHTLALGLWLFLSEQAKADATQRERDLVISEVEVRGEGVSISFGLD